MIGINKYVRSTLIADVDVSELVGTKIYPVVVPDDGGDGDQIKFPVIILNRESLLPTYSKGCLFDNTRVVVDCWSTSYEESVDVATKVRAALEQKKGSYEEIIVNDCRVEDVTEGYEQPAFVQSIVFNFK